MPRLRGRQLAWRLCVLAQFAAAATSLSLMLSGALLNRWEQEWWVVAWLLECPLYYATRARLEAIQGLHRKFIDAFIDNALPPDEAGRRH